MDIPIRAAVIFLFLWLLTRGMGKRELSEMTAFELILLVTVGDLVQQAITQQDMSLFGAALAVGTIALLTVAFSWLSFRFRRAEQILEGVPSLVVLDGKPVEDVLRSQRIPLSDLLESAREQGIDDLGRVRVALVEPDGKFSFIKADADGHTTDSSHTFAK